MLVWTDEARRGLLSRTLAPRDAPEALDPKRLWAGIRTALAKRDAYDPIANLFVTPRAGAAPEHVALLEEVEALVRSDEPPSALAMDVATMLRHGLAHYGGELIANTYLSTFGAPFAFEATLRSLALTTASGRMAHAMPSSLDRSTHWREVLRVAQLDVRAECKQIAASFFDAGSFGQRVTIAFTFFEEAAWGNAATRDCVGRKDAPLEQLYAVVSELEVARALLGGRGASRAFLELVETFGESLLPVLVEAGASPRDAFDLGYLAEAIALYVDPASASWLGANVKSTRVRPRAVAYFTKHPELARAALEPLLRTTKALAKLANAMLEMAARVESAAVPAGDEATIEELPRVLAAPPWLAKKRPKRPETVIDTTPVLREERIAWRPGEREAFQALERTQHRSSYSPAQLDDLRAAVADKKPISFERGVPDDIALAAWEAGCVRYGDSAYIVMAALARFGDAALPGLARYVDEHLKNAWGDPRIVLIVDSPRLAVPFAKLLGTKRALLAWQWLESHPETAVVGLVPAALSTVTERLAAGRALTKLRMGGVDIAALAKPYGAEAVAAITKLAAWDPLFDCPKTPPKLGAAWAADAFTRPRLENGKALPRASVDTIGQMLAFSPLDPPYVGLEQLKEACDPRSLAELAWDIARAWEHAGKKSLNQWMLMSLVHLADDEVVRRLTPGFHVESAVHVLGILGTNAALMELATIAARDTGFSGPIEEILQKTAERRGMTKDELEEELAPTTKLDADGTMPLAFGTRTLQVGFDERLEPFLREGKERLRALPRPRKDEDGAAIERARTIWKDLKEDMSVIAARRGAALERAMVEGRAWTAERYRRIFLEHPLMKHLARGVVWQAGATRFRIAEDGTLADRHDAPFVLGPEDAVRVPHPLSFERGELAAWGALFSDYELLQPFPQLERALLPLDLEATTMPWPYASSAMLDGNHLGRLGFRWTQASSGRTEQVRFAPGGAWCMRVSYIQTGGVAGDGLVSLEVADQPATVATIGLVEVAELLYALRPDEAGR